MPSRTTNSTIARATWRLALVAALAASLGACGIASQVSGPRTWSLAALNQAGTEHTITVTDRSGRVVDVEFGPANANPSEPVTVAPGKPNALDVAWTGGACDKTTTLDVAPGGPGLNVAVAIEGNGMECDAMGLPGVVRLTFAEPVAPGAVRLAQ
jgi:hypothetical protein